MPQETQRLALLRLLEQNPNLSQRELAQAMGVSLGKANYCLKALIEKGFVKFGRFRQSANKPAYAYLLTPAGIEEKTRIVRAFLRHKEAEYEAIQQEIESLRRDLPDYRLGAS
jgi:EPS-associated MarR family transcriptional regulator